MSKQASRSSILTQSRPPCTAVKGCPNNAAVLSYELPGGKRVRICAMHLQRMRRTGQLGGPTSSYRMQTNSKAKEKAVLEAFRKLRSAAGTEWRLTSNGRVGSWVVGVTRRQAPEGCSAPLLRALERRGWIRIGPWREDGSRLAEILAKGVGALEV